MKQKVISGVIGLIIFTIFTLCMISFNSDFFDKKDNETVLANENKEEETIKKEDEDKSDSTSDKISINYNEVFNDEELDEVRYANVSVNVREKDDVKSGIIATLTKNQEVNVIGKTASGWFKINYHGVEGYVKGEFLNKEEVLLKSSSEQLDYGIDNSSTYNNNNTNNDNNNNNNNNNIDDNINSNELG